MKMGASDTQLLHADLGRVSPGSLTWFSTLFLPLYDDRGLLLFRTNAHISIEQRQRPFWQDPAVERGIFEGGARPRFQVLFPNQYQVKPPQVMPWPADFQPRVLHAAKNQSADICKMPPPTEDDAAASAACSTIAQFRGTRAAIVRRSTQRPAPGSLYTPHYRSSFTFFYHNTCENDSLASACVACCPLARTLAHTAFAVAARLSRWRPRWVAVGAVRLLRFSPF